MHKALRSLGIALSIAAVMAGVTQHDGLNLLMQQIRTMGARQWLGLMAGSALPGTLAILPVTNSLTRLLPARALAFAGTSNANA